MRKAAIILSVLAIVAIGGWFFVGRKSTRQNPPQVPQDAAKAHARDPDNSSSSQRTPPEEVSSKDEVPKGAPYATEEKSPVQNFGRAVPVKADASPQAASVNEALRTKQHPERLSAMLPPKPFDRAVFEADPAKYLNVSEPGRCYQSAAPGKDVPVLTAQSPLSSRIKQGESIRLTVKCAPLAPFSVSSFDGGAFAESKLSSVTVRADKEGIASVTFIATPGTLNDCRILGASPLCSGQTRFVIEIEPATNQTP